MNCIMRIKSQNLNLISRNFLRQISCSSVLKTKDNKWWLVSYEYGGGNVVERRAPLRQGHLAHVKKYADEGKLLLGGAFADPVDGAAIVFKGSKPEVEEFIKKDPYVTNQLVTKHAIREWTVVAGTWLNNK